MTNKWDERPLESAVEAYYRKEVKKRNGVTYKLTSKWDRSLPDRVTTLHSNTHFVELKREGGTATEKQQEKHDEIRAAGGTVYVLAGHTEVDEYFREMDLTYSLG